MAPLPRTGGTVVSFNAAAAVQDTSDEARRAVRRRVLKSGIAAYNDRHITLACTVRDLSATGARVRLESLAVSLPDTFELLIAMDAFEADCQVVWRKGSEAGIKFIGAPRTVSTKRHQAINPIIPPSAPTLRRKPKPEI